MMDDSGIISPDKENIVPNLALLSESLKSSFSSPASNGSKRGQWYSPCNNSPRARVNSPEADLPYLKLTHFAKTPRISFGNVRVGSSKTEELVVWNPNSESKTLRVEKLPTDRGFTIAETEFQKDESGNAFLTVNPEEEVLLQIKWEPKESGRCRELIVFKWAETRRVLAIVFGTAVNTTSKKKSSVLSTSQFHNKRRGRWSLDTPCFSVVVKEAKPKPQSPLKQLDFGESTQLPMTHENITDENHEERRETYVIESSKTKRKTAVCNTQAAGPTTLQLRNKGDTAKHLKSQLQDDPHDLNEKSEIIGTFLAVHNKDDRKKENVSSCLSATQGNGFQSKRKIKLTETKKEKSVPRAVVFSVQPNKKPDKRKVTQHRQPRMASTGKVNGSASLKKTRKVKLKVSAKGVAPTKLKLVKPPKTSIPRHPMPFAAKNMYYDERWIEKQEAGFTRWLNFVLTPPDDCDVQVQNNKKVDLGSMSVAGTKSMKCSQPLAPTKEDLSFRTYTARRRMARLRRGACMLYQSEPLIHIIRKVEAEVEEGRLAIRPDKKMHADLGIKQCVINMILSYNPLWLRIGLETVFGEIMPVQHNSDVSGLAKFLSERFLGNPDIARLYCHAKVPGLFRDGYVEQLAKFTLKKFLLLVLFLDHAKLTRLIDHDPCLFNRDAQFKSSRSLLLTFSREYLKGEGDVTKHLNYLGYSVTHQQRAIDEFDYAVTNISTDLRDGLRITRVVELLTHNWQLTASLRVPAISRLQKIHNVEVFMKALKESGIRVNEGEESGVNPRHVVDGHREKTLNLLWMIIFNYQVNILLNNKQLQDEIYFLENNKDLQLRLAASSMSSKGCTMLGLRRNKRDSLDNGVYFKSERLRLLLKWCRLVCKIYGLKVENFTVSFSDGRALCYLLHYYHPSLLPLTMIKQDTTLTRNPGVVDSSDSEEDEGILKDSWAGSYSPGSGTNQEIEQLKANERENFKVLAEKIQALGGIPLMTKFSDMSNTIPDEKVVITYTSYLCARLLDLRNETRAARSIQVAWKRLRLRRQLKRRQDLVKAAVVVQALARAAITRRRFVSMKQAAVLIQSAYRGHRTRQKLRLRDAAARRIQSSYRRASKRMFHDRAQYLRYRRSVVTVQAIIRGKQCRRMVLKIRAACVLQAAWRGYAIRIRIRQMKAAVIKCQSVFKGVCQRRAFLNIKAAAVVLQRRYRAAKIGRDDREGYLKLREATVVVQAAYRGARDRAFVKVIRAAIATQSRFRMMRERKKYLNLRQGVIKIQTATRKYQTRKRFIVKKTAVRVLQTRYRAYKAGRVQRDLYSALRSSCVKIQACYKGYSARRSYVVSRDSAIKIQTAFRRYSAQAKYQRLRASAIVIQQYYRSYLLMKSIEREFTIVKSAALKIQTSFRQYRCRKEFTTARLAAITIQAQIRCHLSRKRFLATKDAVRIIQSRYFAFKRGRQEYRAYHLTRGAIITIQAAVRGFLVRQEIRRRYRAATVVQTAFRGYAAREEFAKVRAAVLTVQRRYRALVLGRADLIVYRRQRMAAIVIQAHYRGQRARKEVREQNHAAVTIQAAFRCFTERSKFKNLRRVTCVVQRRYRALLLGRADLVIYRRKRMAAIVIQAHYRGQKMRKEVREQNRAAVTIQAAFRCFTERSKYKNLRRVTCVVQRRYRALVLGRADLNVYRRQRMAAIVIQAHYRGQRVRKEVREQNRAAVTIQAAFRCFTERSKFKNLRRVTCVVQRRYRALLLGRADLIIYRRKRMAAIVIQAHYREQRARKEVREQNHAAVTIQAAFRCFTERSKYKNLRRVTCVVQRRYRALLLGRADLIIYRRQRMAAIVIQAHYRGQRARKEVREQNHAAVTIQAAFRCFTERSKYKNLRRVTCVVQRRYRALLLGRADLIIYRRQRMAAIVIQAYYREQRARKEVREQNHAAVTIQAAFRCFTERSKYKNLRRVTCVVQRRYRSVIAAKVEAEKYQRIRSAVITIQAFYRGHRVRKEIRLQNEAATTIQTALRCHVEKTRYNIVKKATLNIQRRYRALRAGRRDRERYRSIYDAVVTLQAAYRGKRARVFFKRLKAIVCLQSALRGYFVRKEIKRMSQSAVCIQACFRGYVASKQYHSLKKATIVLQRRYRVTQLGRLAVNEYTELRKSVITIQAVFRGFLARREVRRLKALIKIQSAYRGYVARREYMVIKEAVVSIQVIVRIYLAVKRYDKLRAAAITIQRRQRAKVLGMKVYLAYHVQRGACIVMQTAVRGYFTKKRFTTLRSAAVVIQRRYRALVAGRCKREQYLRKKTATVIIQAFYRGTQARELVRKHRAARLIQASYKMYKTKMEYLRYRNHVVKMQALIRMKQQQQRLVAFRSSVVVIQRRFRATVLAVRQRNVYQVIRRAVITLQAAVRGFIVRRTILEKRNAAVIIQTSYRCYVTRQRYQAMKKAALTIQIRYRAALLGHAVARNYISLKSAAVRIQARYRGFRTRQEFKRIRAAIRIQAAYKAYAARSRYLQCKNSAVIIQSAVRKFQAWKSYQRLRSAATVIQQRYRAQQKMEEERVNFLVLKYSCVALQAAVRAWITKQRYQTLRRAVISMQRRHRASVDAKYQRREYLRSRDACVVIQAAVRACKARKLAKEMRAVRVIQSCYRMHRARQEYLRYRNAVVKMQALVRVKITRSKFIATKSVTVSLQRRFRANMACKKQREYYVQLQRSVILMQLLYLGNKARSIVRKMVQERRRRNEAATKIQRFYRGYRAMEVTFLSYHYTRGAVITLQAAYRGQRARGGVRRLRAAITIQAFYRGTVARKRYNVTRTAVIKIQAAARCKRVRTTYLKVLQAVHVLQQRYRARTAMQKELQLYKETRTAVIRLQSMWRGRQQRARYRRVIRAVVTLQSCIKMWLVKRRYMEVKEAVAVIQTRYHAYRLGKACQIDYQRLKEAVLKIQSCCRGLAARRHVRHILAARIIQRRMRALLQGRKARRDYFMKKQAAGVLQAAYRGRCGRVKARLHRAARVIQANVRGFVARRRFERMREERRQRLIRFSSAVLHHLSAIKIQKAYRQARTLAMAKKQIASVIAIQLWWRGVLHRRRFLVMRSAAIVIQREIRRCLVTKHMAATKIQALARVWLARRHIADLHAAALRIQACWRGYQVRRDVTSLRLKKARKRIRAANEAATEPMKLCNRIRSALDYLLRCKNLTTIFDALVNLEVVTRLSYVCCEQLVKDDALCVIFTVVRNSNRSLPHMEIIKYALAILINVVKCPATYRAVYEEKDSIHTLLELMSIYREKEYIFSKTCCVLNILLRRDTGIVQGMLNTPKMVEKIRSIHYLVTRKYKREARRSAIKTKIAKGTPYKNAPPSTPCKHTPFKSHTPFKARRRSEWAMWQEYVNKVQDPLQAVRSLMKSLHLEE